MGERQKIENLLGKINDEDRMTLCGLLVKAGYAVRVGKEKQGAKGKIMYFVEYWQEGEE